MTARTEYQETIATAIAAAGHAVDWRAGQFLNAEELHIDGVPCGSKLAGDRPEALHVLGSSGHAWNKRRLPNDTRKAAAMLLERHAVVLRERERSKQEAERAGERSNRRYALMVAAGSVPGLSVEVHPAGVALTLRVKSLTVEQAKAIGDALRALGLVL